MIKRNVSATCVGIAILTTAVVMAAWPERNHDDQATRRQPAVRTEAVEEHARGRSVRYSGVTQSSSRAVLSFAISARLESCPADVGESVRKGEVIATLDPNQYRLALQITQASLAELEARLAQAQRDEERVRRLAEARAATDEELEKTMAATRALAAAQSLLTARRDDARRVLGETVLRAPFDGTVTAVHRQPGEWAAPGVPIVELVGFDDLELEIEVAEMILADLEVGQVVRVDLPLSQRTTTGRIASVSGSSGPGRLFPVVIAVEDKSRIGAGMAAEAILHVDRETKKTVPLESILNPGSSTPMVICVRDGRAEQVTVTLGQVYGDRIAVSSPDLALGDAVIVAGHTSLTDGDTVEVF
ncbi:MAG: efflux RND transporter periplasmic adaptor subunit [bacterium]|nr:efflux RND transporter periplasmic adaptor subunit [bacterium]